MKHLAVALIFCTTLVCNLIAHLRLDASAWEGWESGMLAVSCLTLLWFFVVGSDD